jgi:pimeloyl-ACP methyl ester carboxylesterase
VVVPCLRGYGSSSKPEGINHYVVPDLVEDIVGLIKWTGKPKVYVVGHDWGGAIAFNLVLTHPQLVQKALIFNAPHSWSFGKLLSSDMDQVKKSWYLFYFQLQNVPETILA